jgi:O-antigen ligase
MIARDVLSLRRTARVAVGRTTTLAVLVGVSAFVAAAATGEAQARLGTKPVLLAVGGIGAIGMVTIFAVAREHVVLAWPILTGAAFAFVQFPRGNPVVTFDRVWIGGMITIIALARRTPYTDRSRRFFTRAFLAFAIAWGGQAVVAQKLDLGIAQWVDALVLPFVLFTAVRVFAATPAGRDRIAAAAMLGGAVLAGIGIAESVLGFELATRSGGALRVETELATVRISGPYPAPEPYGLALLMTLAMTLYWMQRRRGGRFVVGSAFATLQGVAIALTLFRAAWIGAALIVFAAIGIRRHRLPRALYIGGVMALVIFGSLSQIRQSTGLNERVGNTENVWGRLATYEQGLSIFRAHPLLGIGVNRYTAVASNLPQRFVHGVGSVDFPHSSFVLVLAEQGIVGFLPFLVLAFATVQMIRALRRRTDVEDSDVLGSVAVGAALAYLVMSATLTMIPYSASNCFFAMLLGLVAGALEGQRAPRAPS